MATQAWTADHPLAARIIKNPRAFEYYQLLHLIDRAHCNQVSIGHQGPAPQEPIRIRPTLSLAFPACDLDVAEWEEPDGISSGRILLTTTFLGLYGSNSPLPTHFTEELLDEEEDDQLVRAFLDQFHHRIYSLLYRCWAKFRYYVVFRPDGLDPISQVVRALLGIGTAGTFEGLKVPPLRFFRYVGLYSQRPRSAAGLMGLLRDYFGDVEVDIEQCVGRWLPIQPNDRNVFGQDKCTLGEDFLIGERVFDRSGKLRIKVGPVDFKRYTDFLPTGTAAADLAEIVRFYCGDPLEFDTEVTLAAEEVPDLPLGEQGMLGRLSWTSWLKSKPCEDKAVIFRTETPRN